MFVVYPFPFLSQSMRWHFREVKACAMQYVANCDAVCAVLLGDNADKHSKSMIWNDND